MQKGSRIDTSEKYTDGSYYVIYIKLHHYNFELPYFKITPEQFRVHVKHHEFF
jgi:hypothetical protein